MENFIHRVTWNEVSDYLNSVAARVPKEECTGVYGIPRGGLVLAAWLSHKLYVPLLFAPTDNCIIIDDICDSGESLMHYANQSSNYNGNKKNYFITTMFHRDNQLGIKPDYYFRIKGDNWIVFPWEE